MRVLGAFTSVFVAELSALALALASWIFGFLPGFFRAGGCTTSGLLAEGPGAAYSTPGGLTVILEFCSDAEDSLANCCEGEPGSDSERGGDERPDAELNWAGETARPTPALSPLGDLDMLKKSSFNFRRVFSRY